MFHVKQEEGGVPVFGGGLPSLPPAAPAFSLLFCPHPPAPLPSGKGEIFSFLMQGASPLASPALSRPRHLQSLPLQCPAGGVSGWSPAALAFGLLFCPHPPDPLPDGTGEIFCFLMQGAPPLASPGLNPGGTGYFLPCQRFFAPIPPTPFPAGRGDFCFILPGAGAPRHPCYRSRAALVCREAPLLASPGLNPGSTDIPSGRNHLNITEVPLSMHIYESSGGYGGLFQESPDVSSPQKVGIRGRESFEMLLQRKGKCGIL